MIPCFAAVQEVQSTIKLRKPSSVSENLQHMVSAITFYIAKVSNDQCILVPYKYRHLMYVMNIFDFSLCWIHEGKAAYLIIEDQSVKRRIITENFQNLNLQNNLGIETHVRKTAWSWYFYRQWLHIRPSLDWRVEMRERPFLFTPCVIHVLHNATVEPPYNGHHWNQCLCPL